MRCMPERKLMEGNGRKEARERCGPGEERRAGMSIVFSCVMVYVQCALRKNYRNILVNV